MWTISSRSIRVLTTKSKHNCIKGGIKMTLKPLFDKVVIKLDEAKDVTPSGIILTGSAKEKPTMATVIAVGPGGTVDGKEIKMEVKVGDKILYSKYAGTEFKLDDETVTIIRQSDILAIVE